MNPGDMTPEAFSLCLERDCDVPRGAHVLAAVSGGADSTALLCCLIRMRDRYPLSLSCAHVEHGMRGMDSMEDMAFVRALCERERIPFYAALVDAPAYAAEHGCGPEDACRILRYAFLNRTADEIGADVIALAHHAQDQAETLLMRAVRGSDIRGLCAMRMRSGRLIRPLLRCQPEQLRRYLVSIGQPWREDATNADPRYPRNRIRSRVMPELEAAYPGACAALCRLAEAACRDEDYFRSETEAICGEILEMPAGAAIKKEHLSALHPALRSRVLVRLVEKAGVETQAAGTIARIAEAVDLTGAQTVNLTQGAHALCGRQWLCIVCPDAGESGETFFPQGDGVKDDLCAADLSVRVGRFTVRLADEGETGDGIYSQVIPLRLLRGAKVAPPAAGDAMVPFRRHTPVRLSRLMADAGIERGLRSCVPVLRQGKDILWAVGLRPSQLCMPQEGDLQMMVMFHGSLRMIRNTKE